MEITPVEQQKWTLYTFVILLNELDSTSDCDGRIHSMTTHISADYLRFYLDMLFQCDGAELARWLAVKVFPGDWSIDVEASCEWTVIDWEPLETVRESTEAIQHRSARIPCKRRCTQYQWTIKSTTDARKSIIDEIPVLYTRGMSSTDALKDFLKTVVPYGMPKTCQYALLRDSHTLMIVKRRSKSIPAFGS
jgi:hypothetical protein